MLSSWFCVVYFAAIAVSAEAKQKECGGTLTGTGGVIKSPVYPEDHQPEQNCKWIIKAEAGHFVELVFDDIVLGPYCSSDIFIIDGSRPIDKKLDDLCSRKENYTIQSTGRELFIIFNSRYSNQYIGFSGRWKAKPEQKCGGTLTGTGGVIKSPGYPEKYQPNKDCEWIIKAEARHVVELVFDDVDLGPRCMDSVIIRDGSKTSDNMLGKICNSKENYTIQSTGRAMLIRFTSDYRYPYRGFSGRWMAKPEELYYLNSTDTDGFWGSWEPWTFCPPQMHVQGYRLRSQKFTLGGDDTALDDIELVCDYFQDTNHLQITKYDDKDGDGTYPHQYILRSVNPRRWGSWGPYKFCKSSQLQSHPPVVGLRMKIEQPGDGDDTAANEVDLKCGADDYTNPQWIHAQTETDKGDVTHSLICPEGTAVVGMQVRSQDFQGYKDDTALNGLRVACGSVYKE